MMARLSISTTVSSASDSMDRSVTLLWIFNFYSNIYFQGDVTMLSEGSEISSLNEEDVSEMRERYENVCLPH
jgi:hypothetical protein